LKDHKIYFETFFFGNEMGNQSCKIHNLIVLGLPLGIPRKMTISNKTLQGVIMYTIGRRVATLRKFET
jgi:hypothetical protein